MYILHIVQIKVIFTLEFFLIFYTKYEYIITHGGSMFGF